MPSPSFQAQVSLGALQDEVNRLVERFWHAGLSTRPFDGQEWAPPVDLYEHGDRYVIYAEIPGVTASDVEVTHVGNALTVRGERRSPVGEQSDARAIRGERRFGTFCRTINIPGDIDGNKMSARCADGVLEITVPKSEASVPRAVKIDVKEG